MDVFSTRKGLDKGCLDAAVEVRSVRPGVDTSEDMDDVVVVVIPDAVDEGVAGLDAVVTMTVF